MSFRSLAFVLIALTATSVPSRTQSAPPPPPSTGTATQGTGTQGSSTAKPATPQKPPASTTPAPAKTQPLPKEAASPTTGWTETVVKVPIVNEANVYVPRHPTSSAVFLFISGDGGWNLGVVDMARRIMPKGIVIGVSYNALRKAPPADATCWSPTADLEAIAKAVEKQLNLPDYQMPILAGYSSGATMVYDALVTAPTAFSGGLSLGFCPEMPSNHKVCAVEGFTPGPHDAKLNEVVLPKVPKLEREWYVINGIQDAVCLPEAMHAYLDDIVNVHPVLDVEQTGHGFSRPNRWGPFFDEDVEKLITAATTLAKARKAHQG